MWNLFQKKMMSLSIVRKKGKRISISETEQWLTCVGQVAQQGQDYSTVMTDFL